MKADFVPFQGVDHVGSSAPFEDAGLLAHDFERRADFFFGEPIGDLERRVVAIGKNKVFGVEPESHIGLRCCFGGAEVMCLEAQRDEDQKNPSDAT